MLHCSSSSFGLFQYASFCKLQCALRLHALDFFASRCLQCVSLCSLPFFSSLSTSACSLAFAAFVRASFNCSAAAMYHLEAKTIALLEVYDRVLVFVNNMSCHYWQGQKLGDACCCFGSMLKASHLYSSCWVWWVSVNEIMWCSRVWNATEMNSNVSNVKLRFDLISFRSTTLWILTHLLYPFFLFLS